ncbi:tRNA (guanosine(46)-N7)-methyltransferase TrmB [Acidithiobacillus montserratensis]|uniref:tRNA (Guanosine(46)-N7)-methyltransferase TrmB n=1 Tax=Acidithiobacillus montserratensis TaxID=2729135 RepID=A0ACD5HEH8_9PROT|nr:tRNA (guanosine(46)-N7)-methyltransferase TrmB [Acidithiobacillus montserratensis]MBN2680704.1 tRNA (guanosine(46)-N7)-methyltransferase TrmB [Acidithiobacillaceae bacterium]MBU2747531.1 tRNA (guanosine(46)-N7)-methyltransferase TrmB [Acidithiobacillus montserratensis]
MPVMEEALNTRHRPIRSFVLRQGRITAAQSRIIDNLLPALKIPVEQPWQDPWNGTRALTLEIGFGNGEHLAALAAAHPEQGFIGAEVHTPGVGSLLLQMDNAGINNIRIVHDDVVAWMKTLPDALFQRIIIQFPDPWPKTRQQKRRLIQPEFADMLCRLLQIGGELQLATDWADYAEQMLTVLNQTRGLHNAQADNGFAERPANRIPTRFERRGEKLGHSVYDLVFCRVNG